MHTRREPAKESYPPRPRDEDRRSVRGSAAPAELRSVRRCRSPQAGCCPFRGACSIRQPTPAAGGNRSKVAPVRGGLGMIRAPPPRTWPGSREGCTAALGARPPSVHGALQPGAFRRTESRSPRLRRASPSRGGAPPARLLAPDGGCRRPQVRRRRCYAEREAAGLPGPRSREAGAQPIPYLSGWADASRAPSQENQHEGRAREKQRVASGQGRRIKFHSQEDTPIPPWFVWKTAQAKVGGGPGTPLPRWAGGRQK